MLEGKKVILRNRDWEKNFEDRFNWRNNPEGLYWAEPWRKFETFSREEVKKRWIMQMEHQADPSVEKSFEIDTKEGIHIGGIRYFDIHPEKHKCEVGIGIQKDYWGKGYGTDAMKTLLKYLFKEMKLHRVELNTWSENKRAIKCYEKSGFRLEGILRESVFCIRDDKYYDGLIFGILDKDFCED